MFFGRQEERGPVRRMNRGRAGRNILRRRGNQRRRFDCCFDERELKRYYVTNFVQAEEVPARCCEEEAGRLETQEDDVRRVKDSNQTLSSIQYCHVTQGVVSLTDLYVTILF